MAEDNNCRQNDWVSNYRSYALAWGFPAGALLAAVFLDPGARTVIWGAALVWMGVACIVNAARCGRTHCYFTGPFFLIMAIAVVLHGSEVFWLGPNGWMWLGVTLVVGGFGLLWILPEYIWGKFISSEGNPE
jgi:hypothetical protein